MTKSIRILVINPGSTTTKIAVYENENERLKVNIEHAAEQLAGYKKVSDQYDMRKDAVLNCLRKNKYDITLFDAVVARGRSAAIKEWCIPDKPGNGGFPYKQTGFRACIKRGSAYCIRNFPKT